VVRRPAALLIAAYGLALAYFLVTPELPAVGGSGDLNTLVSDVPAALLLAACVLVLVPARDDVAALALFVVGAGLVAGAATVMDPPSVPLANVARPLFAGALGMLLARLLADPAVVIAVPLFAAGIDAASVAGGTSELLSRSGSRANDFLTIYLPAWGGGRAGLLGLADLVFIGFFAASAWRFGLRRRATGAALLLALPAAVAIQVAVDSAVPVIPVLAAALLLPNLDRLPALARRATAES
jgi:hypothetical protein